MTIVEVLIATAIIGIIAASASLSFPKTRLNARNGQCKEVAQTYSKAVGSYAASAGTSFVTADATKANCTVGTTDYSTVIAASGSACVGADGLGFGMLNYAGLTASTGTVNDGEIVSALSALNYDYFSGSSSNHASDSILQALKQLGYVGTVSTDPSVKVVAASGPSSQDYLLVRCCKDGRQAVGNGGSLFAVWPKLEDNGTAGTESFPDTNPNSAHLCGGLKVAPPGYGSPDGTVNAQTPPKNCHYTFGGSAGYSPVTGYAAATDADTYGTVWFAAGNAPVENLTSMSAPCDKNA